MVGDILQPTHLLLILVVALLVLGPKRLPEVGRTLGSGLRDFRNAINGESTDRHEDPDDAPAYVAPAPEPSTPEPATPESSADAAPTPASDEIAAHEPTSAAAPAPDAPPAPAAEPAAAEASVSPAATEPPADEPAADDEVAGGSLTSDERPFAYESSEPAQQRAEPSA